MNFEPTDEPQEVKEMVAKGGKFAGELIVTPRRQKKR